MATTPTKPDIATPASYSGTSVPPWPRGENPTAPVSDHDLSGKPSQRDALQALLAFSALHEQVRRRKSLASRQAGFDAGTPVAEFEQQEQFVLDEVLQLVAERAVAITGADGIAIALAENDEIVLRASAGAVKPDVGARIDRNSAFSGACFTQAQVVVCDDTETDSRVNLQACRHLGARSMIAVPLCGRRRVIGLIEAFSSWPFGFNDSDIRNLSLLAELVLGGLRPEDEDRFAASADAAATRLERPSAAPATPAPVASARVEPAPPAIEMKPAVAQVSAPVETKPAKVEITPALIHQILDQPAVEQAPEVAPSAAEKIAPEPELTFGQIEPTRKSRRPIMVAVLVCIVVGAAIAGGIWWKLKTAQIGSAMVQTKAQPKSVEPAKDAAASMNAQAVSAESDALDSTAPDSASPAAPQDLAKYPRVTGVRHWSSADSSTIVLDLEDQVQYEAHRLASPDRIYFDLHDTQLAPELAAKSIDVGDPLLNRVRIAQPIAGMTRIVLDTKANTNFSVSLEPNPYRLVMEVRKIGVTPKAAVNLFPNAEAEKNKLAIVIPPPTKEDLLLRSRVPKLRIVVDAGHGGWDLGTVGRRGLLEKDLVLEIAERLGKLLQSRLGMDVLYTRQDDNYVALDERASMANQAQADLFVSVHANYSDLPSARGVETYYTSTFSAPGSKEAGAKDAAAKDDPRFSGAKPAVTPVLSSVELHDRIEQSRRLANSVQRSLYGALAVQNPGLRDRGIKEAGFVVLTESAMPGILAEVSFVSSPTDEQKLRSDGYREQIAEALYKGIARYAVASKGVKVAAKQTRVASTP